MKKKALITGICGQDGHYLTKLLLEKDYQVVGIDIQEKINETDNPNSIELLDTDLTNMRQVINLIQHGQFTEVYNLAGVSFIPVSWDNPKLNFEINAGIPLNLLEAIFEVSPGTRIFQASSSELFGDCQKTPQTEEVPFHPRSPYSVNKIYAYHLMKLYREYKNIFAVNGILYNHESSHRPANFVTRKITQAAASIKLGLQDKLELGNLDSQRDWGFAGDFVKAMWLTLNSETPDEYIIATGKLHTVREFCNIAFSYLDLDYSQYVISNPAFCRNEHSILQGDISKIQKNIGWNPESSFENMVEKMIDNDLEILREK